MVWYGTIYCCLNLSSSIVVIVDIIVVVMMLTVGDMIISN